MCQALRLALRTRHRSHFPGVYGPVGGQRHVVIRVRTERQESTYEREQRGLPRESGLSAGIGEPGGVG